MKEPWYYLDALNQQTGPVSSAKIRELWEKYDFYVWKEGMEAWAPVGEVSDFKPDKNPRTISLEPVGASPPKKIKRKKLGANGRYLLELCSQVISDGVVSED